MIPERYVAYSARTVFSDTQKIRRWYQITKDYMHDAIDQDQTLTVDEAISCSDRVRDMWCPTVEEVDRLEASTGHDVVAFLTLLEDSCPVDLLRYLHYGLTSSDLVENSHHQAMWRHAGVMWEFTATLSKALTKWETQLTPRAGRTHGQVADVTSWGWQMHVHSRVFANLADEFRELAEIVPFKSTGPTGRTILRPNVANRVSADNHRVTPSTQVIPRDHQMRWACLYLRLACALENLALQVRLGARSEVGEVREGADRVGSSAMPHKKNPIGSEKVCGMARLARGYFLALSEGVALWEDRDLTNSATERVAVADLAATVEHMAITMNGVMANLQIDFKKMEAGARQPETISNIMQALAQKHFDIGPVQASEVVRNHVQLRANNGPYIDGHAILKIEGATETKIRAWAEDSQATFARMF